MLFFEEKFFEGETREGFYIEPMMKRAWAAQLEVLKEIERICRKYGLVYFANWGTLLGAVRHKGFVPWDDDIDIIFFRKDWNEFIKHENELPEGYKIFCHSDESEYRNFFTRIVNSTIIPITGEKLKRYHGFPYIAGIDVEILDNVSDNNEDDEMQKMVVDIIVNTEGLLNRYNKNKLNDNEEITLDELNESIAKIEEICAITIDRGKDINNQLFKLCDNVSQIYNEDETTRVQCVLQRATKEKDFIFDKNCFSKAVEVPFENTTVLIPSGYESILKFLYGDDYMIPKRGTAEHDYPYYENQQRELMKINGIIS